ncbi:heme ABC transporter substrate-binding protein IsdE [Sutcliffiella halmapala]|uniref:heme ABC transporter substrate-binding protein IsdE n=1 Tax=Sutcliffiella halmapala TaxID=79882 RepID=UPI000994D129|nr:heme ABC transporter substrate-binding protein IsdE [Sutcliffiella halmapala]
MKKLISTHIMAILFILLVGCSANETKSEKKEAAEQNEVAVEEELRLVSTTVAATEIFDALELDLVGIPTSYKDIPKRYEGVQEVGNPMSPDMELVKSLAPTDVFSVTTLQTDLEEVFERVNLDATFLNFQSLDSMLEEIRRLGENYDREKLANELVHSIQSQLEKIESDVAERGAPTVLILLGVPGSYLVATEHSYIGDLVKRAGGINIVQGEEVEYLASNTEYLQQANPDVILRAAHGMPEDVIKMFDEKFQTNDIWKHFNAVKNDRVYDLEEELFPTTGNLSVVEAMDELVKMLYP